MEIFKIDPSNQFKPGNSVSTFDTFIWTERYTTAGEFKLITENDISNLTTLPKGTLISHSDTTEVMIVEDHSIERDTEKKLIVTVSGRSFETFSENRVTLGTDQPLFDGSNEAIVEAYGPDAASDVAAYLLSTRLADGVASSDDAVPDLAVYTDMRILDDAMTHLIERGDIYTRVLELLNLCGAGIKNVRPTGAATTLDIIIHDGVDRTNSVVFYAQYEDLEDGKYFSSIRSKRNYATVAAKFTARQVRDRNVLSTQTGLNRRVMYIPAEDLEGDYDPGATGDALDARGQNALSKQQEVSLVEGAISITARPKFKIHYDVGDIVTLFGEFDDQTTRRVTEHILTVDKTGMSGYPSLSAL